MAMKTATEKVSCRAGLSTFLAVCLQPAKCVAVLKCGLFQELRCFALRGSPNPMSPGTEQHLSSPINIQFIAWDEGDNIAADCESEHTTSEQEIVRKRMSSEASQNQRVQRPKKIVDPLQGKGQKRSSSPSGKISKYCLPLMELGGTFSAVQCPRSGYVILLFILSDNLSDREERKKTDPTAAITWVFEEFVKNCRACYCPSSSKPEIIEFYNSTKGVDALDEKCTLYSTSWRTRWLLAIFYALLNISLFNAYVLFCAFPENPKQRPQLNTRTLNGHLPRELRLSIGRILKKNACPENPQRDRQLRCGKCPRTNDKKTKFICADCKTPICGTCTARLCIDCSL
ncbi:hypothetical protein PR048_001385 [Dryococelus australis]|uniref:PiggyBac transposable element-derived protein domain-containing protein n=1 Tax=Dryococelus australis TaxID=614101 RepID=A0ABQ9IH65_9NEOP|nr:hypothetical protein PR048_001385 [Dryococelus australis]